MISRLLHTPPTSVISILRIVGSGLASPHWVSASSEHVRVMAVTGFSIVAEMIRPSVILTFNVTSNVSLPTDAS